MGMGPMTGRGAGFCAGLPFQVMQIQSVTDLDSNGDEALGECFMRPVCQGGHALVLKCKWAYFSSDVDEKEFLKKQAKFLENQLDNVKKRLDELED